MTRKLHSLTGKQTCLVGITILLLSGFCFGQPAVSLSPKDGPPTTTVQVSGSGFTPYAAIDIYFDSKDEAVAMTDGSGAFSRIAIQAPASAVPGNHWVSAVERSGHNAKQEIFDVHVNWTEFMTVDMERWNPYENVLNVTNVGSLRLKGRYTTGGEVVSSPAVVNDVVYFGSIDTNLYAVRTRTGALLWSYATDSGVESSPAVANGVVYFGGGGGEYALNASTGVLLWSYAAAGGYSTAVANGVVYFGSGDNEYALNASTGTELWSYYVGPLYSSGSSVANGVVYVGSLLGTVYALNANTGALLWSYATDGDVESTPAVANGVVYVGATGGNLYALNANTGALLWSYATAGAVVCSPAVANGVVYFGSGASFYALNASTGAVLWSRPFFNTIQSSPAVANGVVYVGSYYNQLYALDASNGNELWSGKVDGPGSPSVVNGVVYVDTNYADDMYAFGLPKGLVPQPPKRPDPRTLHPDFGLKPVQQPIH